MSQQQRREFLIKYLMEERGENPDTLILPTDEETQRQLLRALFNVRMPKAASPEFIETQDTYLKEEIARKGITDWNNLKSSEPGIYLWRGDITTLKCGAIVNAANSQMLGCFQPNHLCIDNAIHTFAGIQLRSACARYMKETGTIDEPTGHAVVTKAYNLPSDYVLHTVGPIVERALTADDESLLSSCYQSCLEAAVANKIESVAFCCISTGVFRFPARRAAEIAVETVRSFQAQNPNAPQVIFNVFKESDYEIYRKLLG